MSAAPATAVRHQRSAARLRSLAIGSAFAVVLLIPKLLHIRHNPQSWMAFRLILGFAGAVLVVVPLSFSQSWLVAVAGLAMFLTSILLPPARSNLTADDKARELGAPVVLNGGTFQSFSGAPAPVQLFVGPEKIHVLDSQFAPLLTIPIAEISASTVTPSSNGWLLEIRCSDNSAEFAYRGVFARHLVQIAHTTIVGVMPSSPRPVVQRTRAASA